MKQRVRDVSILRTNTSAIISGLIMLAIAPVFCALLVTTGASALSLPKILKDITAPVIDSVPGKSTPTPPTHANNQQATPAASSADSSTTEAATNTSQPAEYVAPLEPMPIYTQDLQQINTQPHHDGRAAAVRSLNVSQNSAFALLQPSEQGWKIFGTPWYWWGLAIVASVSLWWWLAVQKARRLILLAFWI